MKPLFPAVLLSLLGALPASAHHSLASYNRTETGILQGTVMAFGWSNPHVQLVIVTASGNGAMQQWTFEGGSINRLAAAGFNRGMVAPGDKISVTYNPRRDGSHAGFIVSITSERGRTYDTRRSRGVSRGGAEEG